MLRKGNVASQDRDSCPHNSLDSTVVNEKFVSRGTKSDGGGYVTDTLTATVSVKCKDCNTFWTLTANEAVRFPANK